MLEKYPLGAVLGITVIIFTCVGIHEFGSLNMIKHIRPACSGRRYSAKEINEQANAEETIWLKEIAVFAAPKVLIGINKGITVVDYDDIAGIYIKPKHHMKKITNGALRGRMSLGRAMYHAATDNYREWDTYYIMIKTKDHKKMVLTEAANESFRSLVPIINKNAPTRKP